jgi:tetratricopeptide (TPR) repeat protein
MHKYEELEKKYYAKKFKFYLKLFLYILSTVVVLFLLYEFISYLSEDSNKDKLDNKNKTELNKSKKVIVENNVTKIKLPIKEENITKTKVVVEEKNLTKKEDFLPVVPDIEISKEYKLTLNPIYPDLNAKKVDSIQNKVSKKEVKEDIKKEVKKEKTVVKKVEPKQIIKSKEINLMALMNNFENKKTYEGAIKISQILYNKQDFQQAINWAFKANGINPSDYESWLIYAKSLYKINRKSKAQKVLKGYIENYGPNDKIENFLEKIK